jgi:hypothetical protein
MSSDDSTSADRRPNVDPNKLNVSVWRDRSLLTRKRVGPQPKKVGGGAQCIRPGVAMHRIS